MKPTRLSMCARCDARNYAQKGCSMQFNGITLNGKVTLSCHAWIFISQAHLAMEGTETRSTGTRNAGTPEHRNSPEQPGTSRNTGKSGFRNTGIPEHRNTGTARNSPEQPGTARNSPEHRNMTIKLKLKY